MSYWIMLTLIHVFWNDRVREYQDKSTSVDLKTCSFFTLS